MTSVFQARVTDLREALGRKPLYQHNSLVRLRDILLSMWDNIPSLMLSASSLREATAVFAGLKIVRELAQ